MFENIMLAMELLTAGASSCWAEWSCWDNRTNKKEAFNSFHSQDNFIFEYTA
jgi:hypothetical protein